MEVTFLDLKTLKQAEYNPRKLSAKQKEDLKESIKRFGLPEPIIVNSNKKRANVIIGGHQRVDCVKELYEEGFEITGVPKGTIPTVLIDLSEEKEKELNLRLNRNHGEWDYYKLIDSFTKEELIDVGFETIELEPLYLEDLEDNYDPTEDVDMSSHRAETYANALVKQIVFAYGVEEYEKVLNKLKEIAEKEELESNSDVLLRLLEIYD